MKEILEEYGGTLVFTIIGLLIIKVFYEMLKAFSF